MKRIDFIKSLCCLPLIPAFNPLNWIKDEIKTPKLPKTEKLDLIEDKTNNFIVSSMSRPEGYNTLSVYDNNHISFYIDNNLQWQAANITCPKESAKVMSNYLSFSKFDGRKEFLIDIFGMFSYDKEVKIKLYNREIYENFDPKKHTMKCYEVVFNYEPTNNTLDYFVQLAAEIHKKTYNNNDYQVIFVYKYTLGGGTSGIIFGEDAGEI